MSGVKAGIVVIVIVDFYKLNIKKKLNPQYYWIG